MTRIHLFALSAALTAGAILGAATPSQAGQTHIATMGQLQSAYRNASTELANYRGAKNDLKASRITLYDAGPASQAKKAAFNALLHENATYVTTLRDLLNSSNVLGADTGVPGNPPVSMETFLQSNGLSVSRCIAVHVTAGGDVQLYYV